MPSATQPLPPCPGRGRHKWRPSSLTLTVRYPWRIETCAVCGMRRKVSGTGQVLRY